MRDQRTTWALSGVITVLAGLATSYALSMALTIRESPVIAVAEGIIRITPGALAERAISIVGQLDKPLLVLGTLVILLAAGAWAGILSRTSFWRPTVVWLVLAAIGLVAVATQPGAGPLELLPVLLGLGTWFVLQAVFVGELRKAEQNSTVGRRSFLITAGVVAVGTVALTALGRVVGRGRRHVAESRRLLRLEGVSRPEVPRNATLGLAGVTPWQTPSDDFYLIHTAISVPTIEPRDWQLRIHGMVEKELVLTYDDLVGRQLTESWITLNCVSNEVGGDLIGNAWWSGVRVADVLEEAGVSTDADCVLQTSHDGWTCSTPLTALTDDRYAMLAVAMNGKPLPIEHGFPVRTIVPGLYGYVSATKWVVDFEVTRFADVAAFWTERGWSEQGPVKIASRIDVPRPGAQVAAGEVDLGGVAWSQHTGIRDVEVSVDGAEWTPAQLGGVPNTDTWVQWALTIDVEPGSHEVRVRAIDRSGEVQTGVRRDVVPDGATGWHSVIFEAD